MNMRMLALPERHAYCDLSSKKTPFLPPFALRLRHTRPVRPEEASKKPSRRVASKGIFSLKDHAHHTAYAAPGFRIFIVSGYRPSRSHKVNVFPYFAAWMCLPKGLARQAQHACCVGFSMTLFVLPHFFLSWSTILKHHGVPHLTA
jgi:hypothetical protein